MLNNILLIFLMAWGCNGVILYPSIPSHLLPCYRTEGPTIAAPYRLDVLLSTLRTLETYSQLDLRLFSTSLLRCLRLDGVEQSPNPVETEFLTPYQASGFQFQKYKLLMDLFLPSHQLNLLNDIDTVLSTAEKCTIHKMLSSTVNYWERGDESVVCSETFIQRVTNFPLNSTRAHSRCPIELGVVQTQWGTISPGTVIAAIAAAMEAQRVLVTDLLNSETFRNRLAEPLSSNSSLEDIDIETNLIKDIPRIANAEISNILVATLAGDLAEIAVNQGPRVGLISQKFTLGGINRWNDTLLPRNYYMLNHTNGSINWHLTDAEILAGIDGLIISHYLPLWVEQRASLKLSQLLDMYYSNEGISFDPTIKACNREDMFKKIFDIADLITEVSNFAQVLSLKQGSVFIPAAEMDNICKTVVMAFQDYYTIVLKRNHKNCSSNNDVPTMDLIVATDGSWDGYDIKQFMSWLGDVTETGLSGGSLALLHGNTGDVIVPSSNNLTTFFDHMENYTGVWPNRLHFPTVVSSLIRQLENNTLNGTRIGASVTPSTVVIVVSPSDRSSETESDRAKDLMNTLRATYFDVYFVYVAQDLTGFKNVINDHYDYSETFIQVSSTSVLDVIKLVEKEIIVKQVPKSIVGIECGANFSQVPYEDFVLPNRINHYRIHPYYLQLQPLINIQIRNSGQGSLIICSWRGSESAHNCHTLGVVQTHNVNFTNPCASTEFCPPAHISIQGVNSLNTCANNDCRFPHLINYNIEHFGLRCLSLRGSTSTLIPTTIILFYSFLFVLLLSL